MRLQIDHDRYACYFPQERPLNGRNIRIWSDGGEYLGVGYGGYSNQSGGTIVLNNIVYDSNFILHWCYEPSREAY